jgi:hypothetical protein
MKNKMQSINDMIFGEINRGLVEEILSRHKNVKDRKSYILTLIENQPVPLNVLRDIVKKNYSKVLLKWLDVELAKTQK